MYLKCTTCGLEFEVSEEGLFEVEIKNHHAICPVCDCPSLFVYGDWDDGFNEVALTIDFLEKPINKLKERVERKIAKMTDCNNLLEWYQFCPFRYCFKEGNLCLILKSDCMEEECPYKEMIKK